MDYIFYIVCAVASWAIFYYTIKAAIINGVLAANKAEKMSADSKTAETATLPKADRVFTIGQIALQDRYEKGEITLEQYRKDWDSV